jgi:hypothetical protein
LAAVVERAASRYGFPMKHATETALERISDLLEEVRVKGGVKDSLREKKTGVFYRGSKAFLHFHEDPAGMFADLRVGEEFERFAVNSAEERRLFLSAIERALRHS